MFCKLSSQIFGYRGHLLFASLQTNRFTCDVSENISGLPYLQADAVQKLCIQCADRWLRRRVPMEWQSFLEKGHFA